MVINVFIAKLHNYRTRKNGMRKKTHQVGRTNSGLPRPLQFGTKKFLKYKEKFTRKCLKKHTLFYICAKQTSKPKERSRECVHYIYLTPETVFFVSKTEYDRLSVMSDILHRLASANLLVA